MSYDQELAYAYERIASLEAQLAKPPIEGLSDEEIEQIGRKVFPNPSHGEIEADNNAPHINKQRRHFFMRGLRYARAHFSIPSKLSKEQVEKIVGVVRAESDYWSRGLEVQISERIANLDLTKTP